MRLLFEDHAGETWSFKSLKRLQTARAHEEEDMLRQVGLGSTVFLRIL